jgi:hypothetical protein
MNALRLAMTVVRAWTRVYTYGLPPAERIARRAEIDSDLWESKHDPDASRGGWAAMQVLARLLIGIPDDLAWRTDVGATPHGAPARELAAAGVMTGPRRMSAFGLAATIHVVAVSAVVSVVSQGPVPSPHMGPAAGIMQPLAPGASVWNQRVRRGRNNAAIVKMSVQPVATAPQPGPLGVVRSALVALAERVGLTTPPRLGAPAESSASEQSAPRPQPSSSPDGFVAKALQTLGLITPAHPARQASIAASGKSGTAQPSSSSDRFVAKLLQSRYSLAVRNGQLAGSGAEVLQSAIAQSRFVLLGEDHGNAQTAEFWSAVCTAARREQFHTMAVEEGPLVAAELEGWARRPNGLAQLMAFRKEFPESINVSREEFDMLQRCSRVGQQEFHLWGLNQEGLGAGGLILSRVLANRVGSEARSAMQQLIQKNDDAYRKAVRSGSIFDLFMIAADDKELASGAALLEKDGSREAQSLFGFLIESHEINRTSPPANIRRRERLMKTLFAANYTRAASAAETPPKVLLKFGAYHVYRGLNPMHGSGIGNYVSEFAEGQGAQSLHIRLMAAKGSQPIYPRVGQPAQQRPFNYANEPGFNYLQPMFGNLLPSDWTMFDLRPLRQGLNAPGAINPELATLIFGFDILVMVPEGTPSTEIR